MNEPILRVQNISKRYYLGAARNANRRLGESIADAIQYPFKRIGGLFRGQPLSSTNNKEPFWALSDVSFEINRGDVVGIIGHNGAGKSTLLKILSRITKPTKGYAEIAGRVSSLLEVGTGFHPELTGRENIYLNGSILGMRKNEIAQKFDEIIDFAEISQFIDTPVKHYSSGMYVRLAFSVAAHLEPEVLLVDEVLAVGDVAFQKKCLGKMDYVSKQGRTIIFVSHNLNALQKLCPRSILLERGKLVSFSDTSSVIQEYLSSNTSTIKPETWVDLTDKKREGTGQISACAVSYSSKEPEVGNLPYPSGPLFIDLDIVSDIPRAVGSVAVIIYDRYGTKLVNADSAMFSEQLYLHRGHNNVQFKINKLYLNPDIYTLAIWIADPPSEVHDHLQSAIHIEVVDLGSTQTRVKDDGAVVCDFDIVQVPYSQIARS
jgi:lipopolysaccharide transport system ATP-binding protein